MRLLRLPTVISRIRCVLGEYTKALQSPTLAHTSAHCLGAEGSALASGCSCMAMPPSSVVVPASQTSSLGAMIFLCAIMKAFNRLRPMVRTSVIKW